MTLLFFLKLLGEYAFYFILANYFARQSGGQGLPMALVFLPPAVICLSSVLHTKKPALEKLPLLLLLPAFWLLSHRADQAVYLLACAYGCVLVFRHVYQHSYDTAVSNFQRCAAILVLVYPLLCLVSGGRQALEQGVPLALLFLGVSILQMRMLRHDDQTLNDRRFLFQNLLALAGVTCLGLLASSQVFLGLLRTIGAFFYNTVVLTVIRLGLAVVLGVCWAASQLYGLFDHEYTSPSAQQIQLDLGGPLSDMEYAEITGAPHWVQYLVQGLLIALLVAAVAYILYKLAARRPQDHRQAAFTDQRERLERAQPLPRRELFSPRDPRHAVRHYYLKFLRDAAKRGVTITPECTTEDIERRARACYGAPLLEQLRRNYLQARYSPDPIPRSLAKETKQLYNEIIHSVQKQEEDNK